VDFDDNFTTTKEDIETIPGAKAMLLDDAVYLKFYTKTHLSLEELCDELNILPSWVKEWSSQDEQWQELLEEFDKKPEPDG